MPRPGESGHDTWEGDAWQERDGRNVWSMMSVDEERGIVFCRSARPPTISTAATARATNLFGNSLVALDAATGKRRWHYQTVHHDLWDYDLPAQPALVDRARAAGARSRPWRR